MSQRGDQYDKGKALAVGVCLMHVSGVPKNGAKAKSLHALSCDMTLSMILSF